MSSADLFEKLTLTQVARWLDLHPCEVARIIGHQGAVPPDLRFEESAVDELREAAGVQTWWVGDLPVDDDVLGRALVRSLAALISEKATSDDWTTRADNLFRGLEPADQWVVRRAVNQLIREGVLLSVSRATGLHVSLAPGARGRLEGLADGTEVPASLEALWT